MAARPRSLWAKIGVGVAGAALVVAGAAGATTAGAAEAKGAPPASVTVQVQNGHLTDAQGNSLYLFVADTGNTSTCNGACAAQWPPLVTQGAVQAGSGVDAGKLATSNRQDNTKQVTYNNHPLYRFIADTSPGQTNGQGVNAFGALWWLVNPNGDAITSGGQQPTPGGGITY